MGIVNRTIVGAGMIGGGALAATFWLYLRGYATPLVADHAGIWSSQWQLFQWTIPLACILVMFLGGAYLVYGGVQEERSVERQQRRMR